MTQDVLVRKHVQTSAKRQRLRNSKAETDVLDKTSGLKLLDELDIKRVLDRFLRSAAPRFSGGTASWSRDLAFFVLEWNRDDKGL